MDKRPVSLIFTGIVLNVVLFWAAYTFKLPLLPYHTGTVFVSVLCGSGAGILTTLITFLGLALFVYEKNYFWFAVSGILIAAMIGGQHKKETRIANWLTTAGLVFVCDLFFYILFTILFHDCIPYDYCGQRIFMFFYEGKMEEVFCTAMAGTAIILLSSIQSVVTALLCILCTPKKLLLPKAESENKSLERQKEKNHST